MFLNNYSIKTQPKIYQEIFNKMKDEINDILSKKHLHYLHKSSTNIDIIIYNKTDYDNLCKIIFNKNEFYNNIINNYNDLYPESKIKAKGCTIQKLKMHDYSNVSVDGYGFIFVFLTLPISLPLICLINTNNSMLNYYYRYNVKFTINFNFELYKELPHNKNIVN
jgi:hypothetical protein